MIILEGILKLLSWAIAARKEDVKDNKKNVVKWAIATTSTSVKKLSCNIILRYLELHGVPVANSFMQAMAATKLTRKFKFRKIEQRKEK